MNEIVIVGASLAGVESARALRSLGYDGRLTIVGEEPHRPYDRPPLSKGFLLGAMANSDLGLVDEQEELGVTWRTGVRAVGLDPAACRGIRAGAVGRAGRWPAPAGRRGRRWHRGAPRDRVAAGLGPRARGWGDLRR